MKVTIIIVSLLHLPVPMPAGLFRRRVSLFFLLLWRAAVPATSFSHPAQGLGLRHKTAGNSAESWPAISPLARSRNERTVRRRAACRCSAAEAGSPVEQAVIRCRDAVKSNPKNDEAWFLLGVLLQVGVEKKNIVFLIYFISILFSAFYTDSCLIVSLALCECCFSLSKTSYPASNICIADATDRRLEIVTHRRRSILCTVWCGDYAQRNHDSRNQVVS